MTAQPADPVVPGRFIRHLGVAVTTVALPAPFVASYVIALRDDAVRGAEASAVVVAAEVLAWLVANLRVATHDTAQSDTSGTQRAVAFWAVLPLGILVWMMVGLLHRGSAVGIWAALPIMTTVAYSVALGASRRRTRPVRATAAVEPVGAPPSAPADTGDTVHLSETEGASESSDETASLPGGVPPAPQPQPHQRPSSKAKPDRSPAVGVDESFWTELTRSLCAANGEQGGVALTTRGDGMFAVVGVVLPKQLATDSVRCEFSVLDVERVRDALDSLGHEVGEQIGITWLHTHPGLGVFLSGTDMATSTDWRNLDPYFAPIVVDVSKSVLADQIGVFGPDNLKMSPISLVPDAIDPALAGQIRRAVLDRYDRENLEAPEVIVGGAFSDAAGGRSGVPVRT